MSEHDTERFRIAQSMDELMIRTVGLMESLPERITKLEMTVREIEKDFASHRGEQDQGIKRTVDRVERIEQSIKELNKQFEECKKDKVPSSIKSDLDKLAKSIGRIEREVKELMTDLLARKETRKTIGEYTKEIIKSFIGYIMLPFTIIILIVSGVNPSYIPW